MLMEMQISVTTPAARTWLKSSRAGAVLHIFSTACNLADSGGSVLSLVKRQEAMSPFSMLVSDPVGDVSDEFQFDEWLDIDSSVNILSTTLSVGDIKFSHHQARVWNPEVVWEDIRPDRVISSLPIIEDNLRTIAPTGSLYNIFDGGHYSELQEVVKSGWHKLKAGIMANDMSVLSGGIHTLAGLGEGLTPAGDDFLLGVIFSLWTMEEPGAQSIISLIVSEAKPLTTSLSTSLLAAAGSGEAGSMWHWLMEAIKTGNAKDVASFTRQIAGVGHTSGSDALTGFIATSKLFRDEKRWN